LLELELALWGGQISSRFGTRQSAPSATSTYALAALAHGADLPWTYGRLGVIFVSPAMHRWHHAREAACANTNFATVFSVLDRAFGTLSVKGPCTVPLGVGEDMGSGVSGQLAYPLRVWFGSIRLRVYG
jgi:sterol desaturase/sphingolipid hydroxylase (fatty acid hydroxylase superfamily)